MLAMTSPILQMLNEKIDVLSLPPEERKLYESRMKLKSDIATILEVLINSTVEGISILENCQIRARKAHL